MIVTVNTNVDVDVDLADVRAEDLVEELESRPDIPVKLITDEAAIVQLAEIGVPDALLKPVVLWIQYNLVLSDLLAYEERSEALMAKRA